MGLKLITAPSGLAVSLDEARRHCRVDSTDEDALIERYIKAAASHLDGYKGVLNGLCLLNQTWELSLDAFPCGKDIKIPLRPVQSIVSVKYTDIDGNEQTVPSGDYSLDAASLDGWVIPDSEWPETMATANAVRVQFIAGHGADHSSVPSDIGLAVLLMTGNFYANREATVTGGIDELPFGIRYLLFKYHRHLA